MTETLRRDLTRGASPALISLALAACCTPQVYRVTAPGTSTPPPESRHNVLFLGAGFTKADLPAYRKAVYDFVEHLRTSPPFRKHWPCMGFYRMDLTSPRLLFKCALPNCEASALPAVSSDSGPLGEPIHPRRRRATKREALKVDACWGRTTPTLPCRKLLDPYFSQDKAVKLGLRAPNISTVIVLVNTRAYVGAGAVDGSGDAAGLSYVAVVANLSPDDGFTIDDSGFALFEHELGHALGLMDEYAEQLQYYVTHDTEVKNNLWQRDGAGCKLIVAPECPLPCTHLAGVPWSEVTNCGLDCPFRLCCGDQIAPSACPSLITPVCCSGERADYSCCASLWLQYATPPGGGSPPDHCIFSARDSCRMSLGSSDFCEACLLQIRRELPFQTGDEGCIQQVQPGAPTPASQDATP